MDGNSVSYLFYLLVLIVDEVFSSYIFSSYISKNMKRLNLNAELETRNSRNISAREQSTDRGNGR